MPKVGINICPLRAAGIKRGDVYRGRFTVKLTELQPEGSLIGQSFLVLAPNFRFINFLFLSLKKTPKLSKNQALQILALS